MKILPIANTNYKTPNFKSKTDNDCSSSLKDTADTAIMVGLFLNANTDLGDLKKGTKWEKGGKYAILGGIILTFSHMIYKACHVTKNKGNKNDSKN